MQTTLPQERSNRCLGGGTSESVLSALDRSGMRTINHTCRPELVARQHEGNEIHVILDNLSTHKP
jgi:hypothetical protein